MIDAWITKHALTSGIYKARAELCRADGMIMVKSSDPSHFDSYFHGKDWCRTEEEAIARAEQMRLKKISSLRASIAKLLSLEFKVVEK